MKSECVCLIHDLICFLSEVSVKSECVCLIRDLICFLVCWHGNEESVKSEYVCMGVRDTGLISILICVLMCVLMCVPGGSPGPGPSGGLPGDNEKRFMSTLTLGLVIRKCLIPESLN